MGVTIPTPAGESWTVRHKKRNPIRSQFQTDPEQSVRGPVGLGAYGSVGELGARNLIEDGDALAIDQMPEDVEPGFLVSKPGEQFEAADVGWRLPQLGWPSIPPGSGLPSARRSHRCGSGYRHREGLVVLSR